MEESKKKYTPTNYSEAFKRQIVSEFESGLSTKAGLKRKYGIAGNSCISRWLEKYGKLEYPKYPTRGRPMKDKDKQYIKDLEANLRKKEKLLEKQLRQKDAELKAYKKFIEIAERELNIKIVKKSGTK
jgi:transposase